MYCYKFENWMERAGEFSFGMVEQSFNQELVKILQKFS